MNEDLIIAMAVAIIMSSIKSPGKKDSMRKMLAKVYVTIGNTYFGDAEFDRLTGRVE